MSAFDSLKRFYPPGCMVRNIETKEVAVIIEWITPTGLSASTPLRNVKVLYQGEVVEWSFSKLNKWKPIK